MLLAALVIGLSGPASPDGAQAGRPPLAVSTVTRSLGPWRLRVTRDAFARTTTCRLGAPGARVRHGQLVWRLGSGVDTSAAVWRLDAGEPRRQSLLDLPASANLDNPSDGRIVAPVALLAGAHAIEARPTPHARVRRLDLAHLDDALADAAAQGCAPL